MAGISNDDLDKLLADSEALRAGEGGGVSSDEEAVVEISEDSMTATITFNSPELGGKIMTVEEIKECIANAGVVYGVQDDIVDLLALPTKDYGKPIEIAYGKEVVNGCDIGLEVLVGGNSEDKNVIENTDGSVDFFNLGKINNVDKDQPIANIIQPVDGVDGTNVLGVNIIATQPRVLSINPGSGTRISEDGLYLLADIKGQVVKTDGKVTVQNIYSINGDVSATSGNIDFIGNIDISGSVRTGFKVKSGGNVSIAGVVEGADIETAGDLVLASGMQGNKIGTIKCKGDLSAKFIENANVEVEGNIVAEAIMHSNVKCNGTITVAGKKGLLVGGSVNGFKGIKAKTIGSHMATPTEICVGLNIELSARLNELTEIKTQKNNEIFQAQQVVAILETKLKELGALPQDKLEMLDKAKKTCEYLNGIIPRVTAEINKLQEALGGLNTYAIEASDKIYSGVKVNVRGAVKFVDDEIVHCKLMKKDGDVISKIL